MKPRPEPFFRGGVSAERRNISISELQSAALCRDAATLKFKGAILAHISAKSRPQHGIALIITLILLSVITFMAVTFLAVSQSEKGAVTTMTDLTTAQLAADAALDRAKAELLAPMLAFNNPQNFDLLVSTNFVNWYGFVSTPFDSRTNVNYDYRADGTAFNATDRMQNMANLLYNPRPPVFITTNRNAPAEFRYYLDLNRNGRYDTNGWWPEIGTNGLPLANYMNCVGDPEWIGILEHPDAPHSANNKFLSRYAFIAIPAGKTLDLNYAHNYAKRLDNNPYPVGMSAGSGDGFLRNQGVGTWEINLAAFLADLNTSQWQPPASQYQYIANDLGLANRGAAFEDALSLLRFRYGTNDNSLASVSGLFGPPGANAFTSDFIDGYSDGQLQTTINTNADFVADNPALSWPGANNPNHFFTLQDLFDTSKVPPAFTNRLWTPGTATNSYDRYTYYRLLAQLGTDTASEPPGKMNLNYDNLVQANASGARSATNFFAWQPVAFFTNAADRLLRAYTTAWLQADPVTYMATFGTTRPFGVTNIPVFVSGTFTNVRLVSADTPVNTGPFNDYGVRVKTTTNAVPPYGIFVTSVVTVSNQLTYTPALNRLLQLAANMYDATTNRYYDNLSPPTALPTVFRPIFGRVLTNGHTDVYITNFVEVTDATPFVNGTAGTMRDLISQNVAAAVQPSDLIFGVPLIIGAKKGFPNFNAVAMENVFQITRKMQYSKDSLTAWPPNYNLWQTNIMYVLGLSNAVGVAAWNSYRSNYTRPVDIHVMDYLTMVLTNDTGYTLAPPTMQLPAILSFPNATNSSWPLCSIYNHPEKSIMIPLATNVVFLPDSAYQINANPPLIPITNNPYPFITVGGTGFPIPQWGLAITNRLLFFMVDNGCNPPRLIDYVQLNGMNSITNISEEIRTPNIVASGIQGLWSTNLDTSGMPYGMVYQREISLGNTPTSLADWNNSMFGAPASANLKNLAIANFKAFFTKDHTSTYQTIPGSNYTLVTQVPFTPTCKIYQEMTWQINDPLVHYMAADLANPSSGNITLRLHPPTNAPPALSNIVGVVGVRYQPWGYPLGSATPIATNLALIDPLVQSSDDWQFPTNKFPTIGWLGRVHRGTPWQTVFLKSTNILAANTGLQIWTNWTGNPNVFDTINAAPVNDRLMFDLFTTAFNDNAARGQLSVNQDNLAAWSALFSGVVVLSNMNNWAVIQPVGLDGPNSPLRQIVNGINRTRANTNLFPQQVFTHAGDILATPELTDHSPFLNSTNSTINAQNDAVYEWLPQQVMSLLTAGGPRFVIYAYGQALRPAPSSFVTAGGPFFGLCTNYQITAETAARAVVRMAPQVVYTNFVINNITNVVPIGTNFNAVTESFNILPPE